MNRNKRLIIQLSKFLSYRFFILIGLLIYGIGAYGNHLSQQIDQIIKTTMPHATTGILLTDFKTGNAIYQKNSDHYFHPASNTKLFTAMAALLGLGPHYQYLTQVRYIPSQLHHGILTGNLYVQFSGDPSFTKTDLIHLISQIADHSIHQIKGNIIVDNTLFKSGDGLGIPNNDLMFGYAAPANTIIVNQNSRAISLIRQGNEYICHQHNIRTNLIAANNKQLKTCIFNVTTISSNQMILSGCLPRRQQWTIRLAIQHPFFMAKDIIKYALKQQHIQLKGKIRIGTIPKQSKTLVSHHSALLSALIKTMLSTSNNLYANSFTKLLGQKLYGIGSMKAGVNAITTLLKQHSLLDSDQVLLEDGAGLSYYNLITPNATVRLLDQIYKNPTWRKVFLASLPIAGKRGTLKFRMHHLPLLRHVFAKTGTLNTVINLSGYLVLPQKRIIIFSILVNGIHHAKAAYQVQNRILKLIAEKY